MLDVLISLDLDARVPSEKRASLPRSLEALWEIARVRNTEKRTLEWESLSCSIIRLLKPNVTVEKCGPNTLLRSSAREVLLLIGRASMDTRASPTLIQPHLSAGESGTMLCTKTFPELAWMTKSSPTPIKASRGDAGFECGGL